MNQEKTEDKGKPFYCFPRKQGSEQVQLHRTLQDNTHAIKLSTLTNTQTTQFYAVQDVPLPLVIINIDSLLFEQATKYISNLFCCLCLLRFFLLCFTSSSSRRSLFNHGFVWCEVPSLGLSPYCG